MGIIWIPYLFAWASYGHSPFDFWHAATALWNNDSGIFFLKILAFGTWWLLLSPVQAILATVLTWRAQRSYNEAMRWARAYIFVD